MAADDVRTAPIFVDASGRRRRGLAVAGWLGASACTAYLAAFGITLSTNAGVVEVVGQALEPSPYVDDEGGDAGDGGDGAAGADLPADTVVASTPARSHTVVEAVAIREQAPQHVTGGRHAKADPVVAHPDRVVAPPRVSVHVVPRSTHVGRHAATPVHHPSVPHPTRPSGGVVPGTPHSTPDTQPTGDGGPAGGDSSSGGADPTTGTGSMDPGTGSTGSSGGTTDETTTPDTGTTSTPSESSGTDVSGQGSDPVLSDVLTTGPTSGTGV